MERESEINTTKNNSIGAYGLVQWYPSTKLTSWLPAGASSSDIDNQLNRLIYEANNELQWNYNMPSSESQLSFAQFKVSTKSTTKLAEYFARCYEVPGDYATEIPIRNTNANKWWILVSLIQ